MTEYCILNPTGNITALVKSPAAIPTQPQIASEILRRHPEVEQVGFVRFTDPLENGLHAELRMAGGEFCGNASMCAGALAALRSPYLSQRDHLTVTLRVSGAADPVEVTLSRQSADGFQAGVKMPPPSGVEETAFAFQDVRGMLPLVRMEGISHILIENDSPFFPLKTDPKRAEHAVKTWCKMLCVDGLGLMFSEGEAFSKVTPLVYVPAGETVYWEHSCASGSAACAMYYAEKSGSAVNLVLEEPGGVLRVESDPVSGTTRLFGTVVLTGEYMGEMTPYR